MKDIRTLRPDEIELRVGQKSKDGKRATLLLYKTSRTDQAFLDELVGAENWQKEFYECKGSLFCRVGIQVAEDKWVWKADCGSESNIEKEKGEASDAFKRACFNWGIGRELYTAPTIWVNVPEGGIWSDTFTVISIGYDESRTITDLLIVDKYGNEVFKMGNGVARQNKQNEPVYGHKVFSKANYPKAWVSAVNKVSEGMSRFELVDLLVEKGINADLTNEGWLDLYNEAHNVQRADA